MDEEFEKGKQYIIEGLEDLMVLYKPFINLIRGVRMLGITDTIFSSPDLQEAVEQYDQLILVINAWLSDVRQVKNLEELRDVTKKNAEFMVRLMGHE